MKYVRHVKEKMNLAYQDMQRHNVQSVFGAEKKSKGKKSLSSEGRVHRESDL